MCFSDIQGDWKKVMWQWLEYASGHYYIVSDMHCSAEIVQRSAKKYANIGKQDPGKGRQNR